MKVRKVKSLIQSKIIKNRLTIEIKEVINIYLKDLKTTRIKILIKTINNYHLLMSLKVIASLIYSKSSLIQAVNYMVLSITWLLNKNQWKSRKILLKIIRNLEI